MGLSMRIWDVWIFGVGATLFNANVSVCVCVCVCLYTVAHAVYLRYLASGLVQYCPFFRLCFLCGGGGGIRPLLGWGETCAVSILNTCSASASLPQPWKIRDSYQKYEPDGSLRAAWTHLYTHTHTPSPHSSPSCRTCHNFWCAWCKKHSNDWKQNWLCFYGNSCWRPFSDSDVRCCADGRYLRCLVADFWAPETLRCPQKSAIYSCVWVPGLPPALGPSRLSD